MKEVNSIVNLYENYFEDLDVIKSYILNSKIDVDMDIQYFKEICLEEESPDKVRLLFYLKTIINILSLKNKSKNSYRSIDGKNIDNKNIDDRNVVGKNSYRNVDSKSSGRKSKFISIILSYLDKNQLNSRNFLINIEIMKLILTSKYYYFKYDFIPLFHYLINIMKKVLSSKINYKTNFLKNFNGKLKITDDDEHNEAFQMYLITETIILFKLEINKVFSLMVISFPEIANVTVKELKSIPNHKDFLSEIINKITERKDIIEELRRNESKITNKTVDLFNTKIKKNYGRIFTAE